MTTEAVQNEIIPVNYTEIDEFHDRVLSFRNGQEAIDTFTRYRLRLGVYGQRQDDAQMMRVKIPGGIVTAEQVDVLARIARELAPLGKGHITTRENIQFHHLKLEQAEEAMRLLGEVGLTSREACGNTVRNVITQPSAGVDPDEIFDTTPYLIAYVRYFVRKPFTQDMPRKFKTSFSSTASDDAVAPFHDLGLVAARRGTDWLPDVRRRRQLNYAKGRFAALRLRSRRRLPACLRGGPAGLQRGGRTAQESHDGSHQGPDRAHPGLDAFRERVEEELKQPLGEKAEPIDPSPYIDFDYEPLRPELDELVKLPEDGPAGYVDWRSVQHVKAQRQAGYVLAEVTVPQGDLLPEQFEALAQLSRRFGNGRVQLSAEQNFIFRWIRADEALELWHELDAIGLSKAGANEISDVVCCPRNE